MVRGGYVKLYRNIIEWEWFEDGNTYRLFTLLMLLANYESKIWQGVTIERGQLVASYPTLARKLGLTERQVRTALEHLKTTGEVSGKVSGKWNIIIINNYDLYQAKECEESDDADGDVSDDASDTRQAKSQTDVRLDVRQNDRLDVRQEVQHSEANNDLRVRQEVRQEVRQVVENKSGDVSPTKKYKEDKNYKKVEDAESSPANSSPIPYQKVIDLYIALCPGLPKVKLLTDNRRNSIRARWNMSKADPLSHFSELFTKAGKSDFLAGINERAWIADFDWLMKEQNVAKVLEGKYDNSARAPAGLKRQPYQQPETQQQKNDRIIREMIAKEQAKEAEHGNEARNAADNRDIEFILPGY